MDFSKVKGFENQIEESKKRSKKIADEKKAKEKYLKNFFGDCTWLSEAKIVNTFQPERIGNTDFSESDCGEHFDLEGTTINGEFIVLREEKPIIVCFSNFTKYRYDVEGHQSKSVYHWVDNLLDGDIIVGMQLRVLHHGFEQDSRYIETGKSGNKVLNFIYRKPYLFSDSEKSKHLDDLIYYIDKIKKKNNIKSFKK